MASLKNYSSKTTKTNGAFHTKICVILPRKTSLIILQLILEKEAIIYCKYGILQEIAFDFMIIRKLQTGKYKVQLNKNSIQQVPVAISFGFSAPDGMSTIGITFK